MYPIRVCQRESLFTEKQYCNRNETFERLKSWYDKSATKMYGVNREISLIYKQKEGRGKEMKEKNNLKTILLQLANLGVSASLTKSRLEMLKAIAPPAQEPSTTPEPNSCK